MFELLLIVYIFFFLFSGWFIWKRNVFVSIVYFFLFVYSIFALVGYKYFPEYSANIGAYFGESVGLKALIFCVLSLMFLFVMYLAVIRPIENISGVYTLARIKQNVGFLFNILVLTHFFWLSIYLVINYSDINYLNFSDPSVISDRGMLYKIFLFQYKWSVLVVYVLYFFYRLDRIDKRFPSKGFAAFLLFLQASLFLFLSFRIGNRTDVLALALSIFVLEVIRYRNIKKAIKLESPKITKYILGAIFVLVTLVQIERLRNPIYFQNISLSETLLLKDYFAPFHILLGAISENYIDIKQVITSNFSNSLILLNEPYLQTIVAEKFNPGVSTRSTGYAFYIFSEGFVAMGWFGFLYNGFIVAMGINLWLLIGKSKDNIFNMFVFGLLSTQAVNIVRGQSAYFIKDIYMYFIPGLILYFLATGYLPRLIRFNYTTLTSNPKI